MNIDFESSWRPLKRRRLWEKITSQVKNSIYEGKFRPGDKLPSESALSEIFMVGRPVVREALRSLENSGLIFVRPGSGGGAFVRKISSRNLSETFEGIIRLDQVSMEELTEARIAVEMASLPLIFQRIQPKDLRALEQNLLEAQNGLDKGIPEPRNLKFHILLAQASHNQLIIKITEGMLRVLAKLLKDYEYSYERKKRVLLEHRELFQLLKSKQYSAFENALESHIADTLCLF